MGKRGAEDVLAHAWAEQRFPSTCLRLPMVNGERDHNRRVESYLWRILDGGPILLPDGGEEPTRHVYAGDVVRAIVNLLGDAKTIGQAYNLAQEETPTLREIVRVLCDLVGASPRLTPVARERILAAGLDPVRISPFSGRWMSFLDTSRARAELGFTHEPLASYLGKVVASFFAHPPDAPPASYASRDRERDLAVRHSTR